MTQSSKYDFLFEGYDPLSDEGYDLSAAAERLQNALGVEVEVVQAPSQGGLSENYYLAVKSDGSAFDEPMDFARALVDIRNNISNTPVADLQRAVGMLKEDPDYSDREETRQDLIETLEAEIESALPLDKEVFGFHFEEAGFSMSQNTGGESETAAVTVESDGDILIPVREFNVGSLERFIDGIENNEAPEQIAAFRENIPEVMVDAPDAKITVDATPGFEFK